MIDRLFVKEISLRYRLLASQQVMLYRWCCTRPPIEVN